MAFQGDTIRLKVYFKDYSNRVVDPSGITLNVYNGQLDNIESISITDSDKENIGVYFYDYVLPDDIPELIFEFRGLHNNKPILTREKVKIHFT